MLNEEFNETGRRGILLVITAPSGAGKSTLLARLCATVDNVEFSVSYTTRPPRSGEQNGREYHFISTEEFEHRRARNEFLEWAHVHNNYYGTHRESVEQTLRIGKDIVLDIDVQGAAQVRKAIPEAVQVFILPPSFAVLSERLRRRGLDSQEIINQRLRVAAAEVARYQEFDYIIINDDLDTAANTLTMLVRAERQRPFRIEKKIQNILSSFKES
ncbi:MAG: guanylate kinase [Acidobacteriota bacterium]